MTGTEQFISEIRSLLGADNVFTDTAHVYSYSFDSSIYRGRPDAVIRVRSTDDVSGVLKLANIHEVPVIARGGGSSLCGQTIPVKGGIIMDMQAMNRIVDIRVGDLLAVVESGVVNDQLNVALKPHGFFFPPGPSSGSVATFGGMIANNASGMNAIKYGATRDHVLGMTIVLPTGEVVQAGTRTIKNSSGYQIDRLMFGSEGTLGIVTQAVVRITPLEEYSMGALIGFDTLEAAGQGISNVIAYPLIPTGMELMDRVCIDSVNKGMGAGFPDKEALIYVKLGGFKESVERQKIQLEEIARSSGSTFMEITDDPSTIAGWTKGRQSVLPCLSRYDPDMVCVNLADDMAVPISRLPEAVKRFQAVSKKHGIIVATYGHAGDGNLHTKMLVNPTSEKSWRAAEKTTEGIYDVVLELGGTVTGEHGISISKAPYFRKERESLIPAMVTLKKALDPKNILNPGKIDQWKGGLYDRLDILRYPVEGSL